MAKRGVYTEAEKKMIEETNKKMDSLVGWAKSPTLLVATEESMKNYAFAVDPKNPLWRDENYARATRWGGIIAIPTYAERIGVDQYLPMGGPEVGYMTMILIGEDFNINKPIHPNDSFRIWHRHPVMKDVTSSGGKGPRSFTLMVNDLDVINQKDEFVSNYKVYIQVFYNPEPPKPYSMPEYGYTKEELEYIDRIEEGEEIRGANIRYWEDVSVGGTLKPVVLGPVTMSHMVAMSGAAASGRGGFGPPAMGPDRASLREFEKDLATGLYYYLGFGHYEDRAARAAGEPRAYLFSVLSRHLLGRLVTNWMGDDGFIKNFHYRHMRRNFLGETLISRGKVINKRVENDEHLVDLKTWLENLRGNTTEAAAVTVSLCSKEVPFMWK